jgi:serine protease Do
MRRTQIAFTACVFLALAACGTGRHAAEAAHAGPTAVATAASAVIPALVRIHVVEVDYESGREVKSEATGSGVILTAEGHVITNHHVAGKAKQLLCTLSNRDEIDADLVGTDPLTDICVIKLLPGKDRRFPVATFGDSSLLEVGDQVLAMGSPHALSQSVTVGVVSNTELVMPDLYWPFKFEVEGEDVGSMVRWIGHDAELNPGNSGGPLVNLKGQVVGINEMQFGLGAAIPGNLARRVADDLIARGEVVRAWLGLEAQPLLRSHDVAAGVLISGTIPGSPAEAAGLQSGDIILALAGREVSVRAPEELPEFNRIVADLPLGEEVAIDILRDGAHQVIRAAPRKREPVRMRDRELSEWGITARDLSLLAATEMRRAGRDGVLVTTVRPGGPCDAAKPKIVPDDVILQVAGKPVTATAALVELTAELTDGAHERLPVLVAFDRKGQRYLTVVEIGREPTSSPAREVRKAWLGVSLQVLTREIADALDMPDRTGVRLTQVYPGTSAEKAGLAVGDFIVALDGREVPASRPQHFDVFAVIRDGREMTLTVTLDESPAPPREMTKYRDDLFEFSVRDVTLTDQAREHWQEKEYGPLVQIVSEGGWAALGHLAVGDVVLAVDGRRTPDVVSLEEIMKEVGAEKPEVLVLEVRRGIHTLYIELKPKWPAAG